MWHSYRQVFFHRTTRQLSPLTGTLANSGDPDEMQHNAAFHQGLHCLLILKQSTGIETPHNIEKSP